ncbi:MAG: hypothetical protein OHK0053_32870 [Microscillaceae bacterium]
MKKLIFYFIKYCLSLAYGLSPTLGNRLAFTLFTRPLFQIQKQSELKFLKEMENSWLHFEGNKIRIYKKGFGKRIILLVHGWRGYAGNFCELMTLFPDHEYTLITFDAPAHNASTGKRTNVFQIIRLCSLLIESYMPDYIVGHSMGSAVAISALTNVKHLDTEKLILLSCPNSFEYLVESFGKNFSLKPRNLNSFR